MKKNPILMKVAKGAPMQLNYGSPMNKNGDKKKKVYPQDYTDEEIDKVIKRNLRYRIGPMGATIPELVARQDSMYTGIKEIKKRFEKSGVNTYKKK